jgi:hypothetical protein
MKRPALEPHMRPAVVAVVLFILLSSACKGDPGAGPTRMGPSCRAAHLGVCVDFDGAAGVRSVDRLRAACSASGGEYAATACPKANRVASCLLLDQRARRYYASGDVRFTRERAERDCVDVFHGRVIP